MVKLIVVVEEFTSLYMGRNLLLFSCHMGAKDTILKKMVSVFWGWDRTPTTKEIHEKMWQEFAEKNEIHTSERLVQLADRNRNPETAISELVIVAQRLQSFLEARGLFLGR